MANTQLEAIEKRCKQCGQLVMSRWGNLCKPCRLDLADEINREKEEAWGTEQGGWFPRDY